ncbi:unnamed protein product [Rotaria sordida]|uniref:PDZ domain-containing protein n=1 Tax=Rotaria sordida TaxID=392033 RepID=A0A814NJD6_9BILA|nr:unnamed protein product [Rotaria sordida]CAF3647653.1 unnamed protein product [Rotaria sordida]
MSSNTFSKQNSSSGSTHRTQTRYENNENNSQHNGNRRSLSGKFRNLFRKTSASPNRTTNNGERLPPPASTRQRSLSPEVKSAATEPSYLRAPLVSWPFRKKKSKSPATINGKTKTTGSRKTKKTTVPPLEISGPIYQQEYQTSIHGQNFVPRTPEHSYGSTGRPHSASNYETTTKGFRDYMIIDHAKSSQQVIVPDTDIITPPPYSSNRNRSPSTNRHRLPDTNIEYSYHNDVSSPPISDSEVFHTPKQQRKVGDISSLTAIQTLVDKTPLRPQTSNYSPSKQRRQADETQPFITTQMLVENTPILTPTKTRSPKSTINSNQWKSISSSSLNNTGMHSTVSSSMGVDVPKLNGPLMPLGYTSNTEKPKQTNSQSHLDTTYNSLSTINNHVQPNRSHTNKYGSSPDAEIMHSSSLTSLQPATTNFPKYPGLNAIIDHHLHPTSIYYNEYPSTTISPQQIQRFDVSTTTFDEYDQRQQWSNTLNSGLPSSPSSAHRHDGYIRPLTPQKPSLQTDTNTIRVDIDDPRSRTPLTPSRTSYYDSSEIPVIYRSSTTVYTKDRHNYVDGGEVRTWSIQDNNDIDINQKPSKSIQIDCTHNNHDTVLPKITNEYQYNSKIREQETNRNDMQEENYIVSYEYEQQYPYDERQYSNDRYSHNFNNDRNSIFTQPSIVAEREKIYDQSPYSYQTTEHRQESINAITPIQNSEALLRPYILKCSDSYDGLGILISGDKTTGLNPRIRDIEPGSPAYQLGLRKGDRIIYINGINVEKLEFSDVLLLIREGLNNNNLQLSVINESVHY